jgi:23S rRNA A1618 N6-methylase RlmF
VQLQPNANQIFGGVSFANNDDANNDDASSVNMNCVSASASFSDRPASSSDRPASSSDRPASSSASSSDQKSTEREPSNDDNHEFNDNLINSFHFCVCNPPFHESMEYASWSSRNKWQRIGGNRQATYSKGQGEEQGQQQAQVQEKMEKEGEKEAESPDAPEALSPEGQTKGVSPEVKAEGMEVEGVLEAKPEDASKFSTEDGGANTNASGGVNANGGANANAVDANVVDTVVNAVDNAVGNEVTTGSSSSGSSSSTAGQNDLGVRNYQGQATELVTEGGEVGFLRRMIDESKEMAKPRMAGATSKSGLESGSGSGADSGLESKQIIWYTCMLSRWTSVKMFLRNEFGLFSDKEESDQVSEQDSDQKTQNANVNESDNFKIRKTQTESGDTQNNMQIEIPFANRVDQSRVFELRQGKQVKWVVCWSFISGGPARWEKALEIRDRKKQCYKFEAKSDDPSNAKGTGGGNDDHDDGNNDHGVSNDDEPAAKRLKVG